MSTIKSSDEHLTLNADGSSKDIKFQSNGVEKASISSTGVMTATSFAGSGANLTNLPSATADGFFATSGLSAKDLGDGLHIKTGDSGATSVNANFSSLVVEDDTHSGLSILSGASSDGAIYFGDSGGADMGQIKYKHATNQMDFETNQTNVLTLYSDGRGWSQFTAKAWCNVNAQGTASIRDSHNVSSISDSGTGQIVFNWQHSLGNQHNYCPLAMAYRGSFVATYTLDQNNWESDVRNDSGNMEDPVYLTVAVFSD